MIDTFARAGYSSNQERQGKPVQDENQSDVQHSRVLRALATLLVRNNEIVAVTVVDRDKVKMQLLALGEEGPQEGLGRTDPAQPGSTSASTTIPIVPERLKENGGGSDDTQSKLPLSVSWFAVANPRRLVAATGSLPASAHKNNAVGTTVQDTLLCPSEHLLAYIWNHRPSLPPGKAPGSTKESSIYFDRNSE